MSTLTPEQKADLVNARVETTAVYIAAGDGLNTRRVTGARVRLGQLQIQTSRGFEYSGAVPYAGAGRRPLW